MRRRIEITQTKKKKKKNILKERQEEIVLVSYLLRSPALILEGGEVLIQFSAAQPKFNDRVYIARSVYKALYYIYTDTNRNDG